MDLFLKNRQRHNAGGSHHQQNPSAIQDQVTIPEHTDARPPGNNFLFRHLQCSNRTNPGTSRTDLSFTQLNEQSNPRLQIDDSYSESETSSEEEVEGGNDDEEESEEQASPQSNDDGQNDETESELWKLTVVALKDLLRQRDLPVSGLKAVLIGRLMGKVENRGTVKDWKKSKAKILLRSLIEDGKSKIHGMTDEEIHKSHDWFQDYPFSKFEKYIATIRAANEYLKNVVQEDEKEVWADMLAFPRNDLTVQGYPFWDTHDARILLEKDVKDGKADRMKPFELWETMEEYQAFPENVFCHHLHQEKRRQREEPGWVIKRNKKGRKMHEKDITESKKGWDDNQHEQEISGICQMWENVLGTIK